MPYFDTHAHLFDARFHSDLPEVLNRAREAGLAGILAVGIDLETSRISLNQADGRFVHAAVGIQPNHVAEASTEDWNEIVNLASDARVKAIGETGLDRYWDKAPFSLQEEYFEKHLALSRKLGKPVVIHCREAETDVVRMLTANGPVHGVMHSFTGDRATLDACLEFGLHISFAGMITYKNAENLRDLCQVVPANRLLIETDCPYLSPIPHRSRRNEPSHIVHTASTIAEKRGMDVAEIGILSTENAKRFFGV